MDKGIERLTGVEGLARLVAETLAAPASAVGQRWAEYRAVDAEEAARLREATGMELGGYTHSVSDSEILHIIERHGEGTEHNPVFLPVTVADLLAVPEITARFDSADKTFNANMHLDAITYRKRINGHVFCVVEVRRGRKKLSLKTMWKVIAGAPNAS
jgi:hypothetical protein